MNLKQEIKKMLPSYCASPSRWGTVKYIELTGTDAEMIAQAKDAIAFLPTGTTLYDIFCDVQQAALSTFFADDKKWFFVHIPDYSAGNPKIEEFRVTLSMRLGKLLPQSSDFPRRIKGVVVKGYHLRNYFTENRLEVFVAELLKALPPNTTFSRFLSKEFILSGLVSSDVYADTIQFRAHNAEWPEVEEGQAYEVFEVEI